MVLEGGDWLEVTYRQGAVHGLVRRRSSAGRVLSLYSYFGLGWVLGCGLGGAVITSTTTHCFISRQWLCQVS